MSYRNEKSKRSEKSFYFCKTRGKKFLIFSSEKKKFKLSLDDDDDDDGGEFLMIRKD